MIEAMSFACNLAFAQPNIPFGMHGWSHIINQVHISSNQPCSRGMH